MVENYESDLGPAFGGKKQVNKMDECDWEQTRFDEIQRYCMLNTNMISVLQCVAVCCSERYYMLNTNMISVLQCVAVCCSVLQCVAVCCSVLQ